jgi:hypothetical protein
VNSVVLLDQCLTYYSHVYIMVACVADLSHKIADILGIKLCHQVVLPLVYVTLYEITVTCTNAYTKAVRHTPRSVFQTSNCRAMLQ